MKKGANPMSEHPKTYTIDWLVIPAPDLDLAKSFYANVFHFDISDFSDTFATFKAGNISGGLDCELVPSKSSLSFSVTVDDIPEMLARIVRHGGKILRPQYELSPNLGYCARFEDPNGNELELYAD
jgi:predicted enzyme related to lactoylglutathione lyase